MEAKDLIIRNKNFKDKLIQEYGYLLRKFEFKINHPDDHRNLPDTEIFEQMKIIRDLIEKL